MLIFFLLLFNVLKAQEKLEFDKTSYQITVDYKKTSYPKHVFFDSLIGTVYIKERPKPFSGNSNYGIFHYDTNRQLINHKEITTKKIDDVFITQDSIHLIRTHKKYKKNNSEQNHAPDQFSIKSIDYFISSSSLKKLNFQEKKWFSINSQKLFINNNIKDFTTQFYHHPTNGSLVHWANRSYPSTSKQDLKSDVFITANDTVKAKKSYLNILNIDFFNNRKEAFFSKKIVVNNTIGDLKIEKIKSDSKNKTVFLLVSILDKQKKISNLFKTKINRKYYILKITPQKTDYISIDDATNTIATANLEFHKNKIIIAGLYSETNNSKTHGFFKIAIDRNTLNKNTATYLPFDLLFLNDVKETVFNHHKNDYGAYKKLKDGILKENYRNLNILVSEYIYIDQDGNCLLNIGEFHKANNVSASMMGTHVNTQFNNTSQSFTTTVTSTNIGFHTPYASDGLRRTKIIAAKISNDDKLQWSRAIETKDEESQTISKVFDGVNYIFSKHLPLTHKKHNKNDKRDYTNFYLYAFSIGEEGNFSSNRFFKFNPKKEINLIDSNSKHSPLLIEQKVDKVFQLVDLTF